MAIFELKEDGFASIEKTTFSAAGIKERENLQKLLIKQIEIISPNTLVIAEEFGEWEDSRRRIDVLGVDTDANLVVIKLKRTDDGGHMELQAIRYAAMVSAMTFNSAVDVFERYLKDHGQEEDARERLLEFLDWEEPDEDSFAQEVNIILASGEFSKEITTSVLWLNDYGLDIRCIRLRPYKDGERVLLDIQQVIPLPEAEEYQVRIRDKARLERASRTQSRDLTKYDVTIGDETFTRLPKRRAIFYVVSELCSQGVDPEEICSLIDWRRDTMRWVEAELDSADFEQKLTAKLAAEGKKPRLKRYYTGDDELIHANGKTYALTKMWGARTAEAINLLLEKHPGHGISYRESTC